jgi:uncharacterized protein
MTKEFAARRLDVKSFAEEGTVLSGEAAVEQHPRLMAETQGRGAQSPVRWSASGQVRNARHVQPQVWLQLKADATLSLTCQRCLAPVDVPVHVERSFRFVPDEAMAAAQDEQSEEDVLALSRSFDLVELVEDELLMEVPLAPRHETCPPVKLVLADAEFDNPLEPRENPFAFLGRLKTGKQ